MTSRNCFEDIYNSITTSHNLPLTSIEKYLKISSNTIRLVKIQLEISPNELEISLNELEISSNVLEISANELEISTNVLEISLKKCN